MKVFTGKTPFSEKTAYAAVIISITSGQRPERPDHPEFTNPLWKLTQRCWDQEARNRPKIQDVIKALKELQSFDASFVRAASPTHRHRSTNQAAKPLQIPLRVPDHVNKVTPHDVDTPRPGRTPPPPSKDDGNRNSVRTLERLEERQAKEHEETLKVRRDPLSSNIMSFLPHRRGKTGKRNLDVRGGERRPPRR